MNTAQQEVDKNYEEFVRLLPTILPTHRDKYALMKDKKILGYYSSSVDARTAAKSFIDDGIYSIQRVTDSSVDLGYFSHAVSLSPV
jgi:rhodanese-related sulfurtransferase